MKISLAKWDRAKAAAYSLTWDDLTVSSITSIADQANRRDLPVTIYINAENHEWNDGNPRNNFPTGWHLNEAVYSRLRELHNRGNEIGNHSYSHTNMDSNIDAQSIVQDQLIRLNDYIHSLTGQLDFTFCYPQGKLPHDGSIDQAIQNLFLSARTVNFGFSTDDLSQDLHIGSGTPPPLHRLKALNVAQRKRPEFHSCEFRRILELVVSQRTWGILAGHGVDGDGFMPIAASNLFRHLDFIKENTHRIWCDTVLNVSKYIIQSSITRIETLIIGKSSARVYFSQLTQPAIHQKVPLTVICTSESNFSHLAAIQNETPLEIGTSFEGLTYFRTKDTFSPVDVRFF